MCFQGNIFKIRSLPWLHSCIILCTINMPSQCSNGLSAFKTNSSYPFTALMWQIMIHKFWSTENKLDEHTYFREEPRREKMTRFLIVFQNMKIFSITETRYFIWSIHSFLAISLHMFPIYFFLILRFYMMRCTSYDIYKCMTLA